MDNQEFRGILLKLQDRLSDNDRKRLHFFFGNDVPRRIRDDPSLGGTLSLMESLFDQDKINEQDFTILIKAFNEIQCLDAAKLLQQHKKQMQKTEQKETIERLSSILLNQLSIDEEEDKFNVKTNFAFQEYTSNSNNNIINNNNTNINPFTIIQNQQTISDSSSTRKNFLINSPIIQICLALFVIVLIIILIILTGFYIQKSSHIRKLEKDLKMKNDVIIEGQTKNNETIHQNKILNNKINDFQKEQETSFTRAGTKFGGIGGGPFDDSTKSNFTCSHYLRGMVGKSGFLDSDWFQFIYSSPYDPENIIEGETHGTRPEKTNSESFILDKDEKVIKVQVVYYNEMYKINGIDQLISVVRGLRFFTTKGRASPSLDFAEHRRDTEEFDGYFVGYISGRSGLVVDQIQFHWYRTVTN